MTSSSATKALLCSCHFLEVLTSYYISEVKWTTKIGEVAKDLTKIKNLLIGVFERKKMENCRNCKQLTSLYCLITPFSHKSCSKEKVDRNSCFDLHTDHRPREGPHFPSSKKLFKPFPQSTKVEKFLLHLRKIFIWAK